MRETHDLTLVIAGMLSAGYAIAALYFLKFWRRTGDRLFIWFATAFALLVVQRLALAVSDDLLGNATWFYVIRLLAFALIAGAIIDKNRTARQ